jgi:uncharacterized protein (TIGR00730 family)
MKKSPSKHEKPLPCENKKSRLDDPEAEERINTIMNNPNYIPADQDSAFLRKDEVRGIRLEVDYLKPELLMREHGIEHTIVVFGSTRIVEAPQAKRNVEDLEKKLQSSKDPTVERDLRIARRILDKSIYYDMARTFGTLVGRSGKGPDDARVTLMTGGGPGIMEAANRGAFDVGAKSIGLNITLPHEQFPNPYITPELCFQFHYFAIRKLHFLRRAKALVIFPGGFGTFDESFGVLTLVETRKMDPLPIIFVGEDYWRKMLNFDMFVEEGVIDPEDLDIFKFAESAEEAWEMVLQWHTDNGKPLL